MHLILTGATGTVGAPILRHCLGSPQVTQLAILTRRQFTMPEGMNISKAQVIIHQDYASYPEDVLAKLRGADGCIWAQGTSQTAVSEKQYITITHDFPIAAAKAFADLSTTGRFNFVHISGKGAESNTSLYGRTKARAEKSLLSLSLEPLYSALRVLNVRPAYVDNAEYQPRPGMVRKVVYYGLAPVLRKLAPGLVTPTPLLARVCVDLAVGDGKPLEGADLEAGGRTVLPNAIKRMGSEFHSDEL
ncbi:hypothetical protein C8R47DRAFT_1052224 [Mycena vitilis]|nr:hypothetical protein C8R47DRAFT_1052224 [Mycena vitilis]